MTSTEADPDHYKGMGTDAIGADQGNPIQHTKATVIEPAMTHHTAAYQVTTLRTAVGHVHIHLIDHQNIFHTTEDHAVQDHTLTKGPKKNHTLIGIGRPI